MERNYSMEIADELKNYLKNNDWNFRFDDDRGVFSFGLNIRSKLKKIRYIIGVNEDSYVVYAASPISADEDDDDQMKRIAEFVCRANYGLQVGNFELDFRDGEVRYKCYVSCDGVIPTTEMITESVHCPAAMFTRYGDGIIQVLFNDASAEQTIAVCEGMIPNSVSSPEGATDAKEHVDEPSHDMDSERVLSLLRMLQEEEHDTDDAVPASD